MMASFNKLRYPKVSLALFIIAALAMVSLVIRIMAGAGISIPDTEAAVVSRIIIPILIIAATFLLITVLLWLNLRKKGARFIDLLYPVNTACAIGIFIFFHIALLT